jgi:hypothetical protein
MAHEQAGTALLVLTGAAALLTTRDAGAFELRDSAASLRVDLDLPDATCVILPREQRDPSRCVEGAYALADERLKGLTGDASTTNLVVANAVIDGYEVAVVVQRLTEVTATMDQAAADRFAAGYSAGAAKKGRVVRAEPPPHADILPIHGGQALRLSLDLELPRDAGGHVVTRMLSYALVAKGGYYVLTYSYAPELDAQVRALAERIVATASFDPAPAPLSDEERGRRMGELLVRLGGVMTVPVVLLVLLVKHVKERMARKTQNHDG